MNNKLIKKLSAAAIGAVMTAAAIPFVSSVPAFAYQETGTKDGYDWELWEEYGTGSYSMNPGSNGTYSCSWSGIHNILFRSGKKWMNDPKWTSLEGIQVEYEVEYNPQGNSYFCIYGWMTNPTVEYYICEQYGSWEPPGQGFNHKGDATIDGKEYKIYEGTHTGPSINSSSETFKQYWSIKKNSGNSGGKYSGTITVSKHFEAWEKYGITLGGLREVALNVEGWESSGKANVTKNNLILGTNPDGGGGGGSSEPAAPAEPDADGYWFHDTFEKSEDGWTGRGSASAETSSKAKYEGSKALYVSGRTEEWNGAIRSLPSNFKAGETYSFSVNTTYDTGNASRKFKLTLEYNDGNDTTWDEIASGTAVKGEWLQLANTSYTIPKGASSCKLIVETTDGTLEDFYIDEAIGADKGVKIEGAGAPEVPTQAPTRKPGTFIPGDVTGDERVDTFDLSAMRKGIIKGFKDTWAEYAADVNADGEQSVADMVTLNKFLLGQGTELKKAEIKEPPKPDVRTISEYTPVVEKNVVEAEPDSSRQQKAGVDYGKLESKSYFSKFCGREKKYHVLLPAGYSTDKKYPVLYVMHGYYENQDRMIITGNNTMYTKQIIGNAIAEGAAKEMIVVFPYIYSSKTQADVSGMDDANNQAYDNFDTVLTTELMPLIEENYSVATGRENTAITGFSMGGRESLMIGMKHPDLFGYIGAICPAPGATGAWKFASEEESPYLIFITAGGNDDVVYTTPNGYHENFTKNGVPHVWHYYKNGYHGDNSIHAHLYNFVRAVFQA